MRIRECEFESISDFGQEKEIDLCRAICWPFILVAAVENASAPIRYVINDHSGKERREGVRGEASKGGYQTTWGAQTDSHKCHSMLAKDKCHKL